ncbi:hypothetical protein HanXRQr2_Chr03g0108451 [Helianthus annuus]|uniref:Uncharacterized protein n=1 Tax=Helianthus annuus TaxID=4232 RepID=A0A251V6T5_HELAN|nr:hypothetical protein HanXRQr2_Chr03g0108451 [Helianthus annuus]KAJ0943458.1 hypothetical protein HanPSC8_Chr03g0104961 [Helianthus annuus]
MTIHLNHHRGPIWNPHCSHTRPHGNLVRPLFRFTTPDWNLRSLLVVTMLHSRLEAFSITIMLRVANQLISISTIWNCSYTVANLPMLEISAVIKEFRSRHLSVLTKVDFGCGSRSLLDSLLRIYFGS